MNKLFKKTCWKKIKSGDLIVIPEYSNMPWLPDWFPSNTQKSLKISASDILQNPLIFLRWSDDIHFTENSSEGKILISLSCNNNIDLHVVDIILDNNSRINLYG